MTKTEFAAALRARRPAPEGAAGSLTFATREMALIAAREAGFLPEARPFRTLTGRWMVMNAVTGETL